MERRIDQLAKTHGKGRGNSDLLWLGGGDHKVSLTTTNDSPWKRQAINVKTPGTYSAKVRSN